MEYLTRVGGLAIRENKVLAVRNKTSPIYLIPGGILEKRETNKQALIRELDEELNAKLVSSKIFKTYYSSKALFHDTPLKLVTFLVEIDGKLRPGHEILEYVWLTATDYKSNRYELAPIFGQQVIPDLCKEGYLKF